MKQDEYISDEMVVKRVNEAVRIELEKKKALDVPIVIYDREPRIRFKGYMNGAKYEKLIK